MVSSPSPSWAHIVPAIVHPLPPVHRHPKDSGRSQCKSAVNQLKPIRKAKPSARKNNNSENVVSLKDRAHLNTLHKVKATLAQNHRPSLSFIVNKSRVKNYVLENEEVKQKEKKRNDIVKTVQSTCMIQAAAVAPRCGVVPQEK